MARRVPGIAPGTLVEFVPKHDGNADDPSPVRVFIQAPTQGEKRAHLADTIRAVRVASVEGEVKLDFADVLERRRLVIERFVKRVEGYEDQHGAPIADGETLWERGELGLCSEVADFVEALLGLNEEQRKNSEGSSASSQAATPASSGTAASASPTASTAPATATVDRTPASGTTSQATLS
jgi:hypothetical protein